tara:strand:- start:360 stop:704 length:345 start_codon:yes stop_codon:yes gene_type:complete
MKEKTLLNIALIGSLVGLFILYLVSDIMMVEEISLDRIAGIDYGTKVKVKGIVENVINAENVVIFEVMQPNSVTVVLFESGVSVSEGDMVEVIGEIEEYEGKREVIGDKVRVIS